MKNFLQRAATTFATLALAASGALVATAPAHATDAQPTGTQTAATPVFTSATITGLKSTYTAPKTSKSRVARKSYSFTLNVTGTASDASSYDDTTGDGLAVSYAARDANYDGPSIKAVKTLVKNPYLPTLDSPTSLRSGANKFTVEMSEYVTPGVYEIRVPVRQSVSRSSTTTYKVATKRFTIKANTTSSVAQTRVRNYGWRIGKTATFYVSAPAHQKGAKITLYYKKQGAKKYSKVVTKKLVVKKNSSSATTELKTKKLTKTGHIYFKVTGVKYAPAYKLKPIKITLKRIGR